MREHIDGSIRQRIFEHGGCWLVRRPDTDKYSIAFWPGEGARRIRRVPTGTADLDEAKRRLVAFSAVWRPEGGRMAEPKPVLPPAIVKQSSVTPHSAPTITREAFGSELVLLDLLTTYVQRLAEKPCYHKAAKPLLKHWAAFAQTMDVVYVSELTLDMQERFVAWRRESIKRKKGTVSNGTIIRELGLLKAALRDAWKRGKLASVPYIMSLPSPPSRDRSLTVDQVRQLLAHCDEPHLYRFIMLLLHTLARPISILNLHQSQVDLVNNRIDFLPPGATQSNKRRPVVPITATLRSVLAEAIEQSISGYVIEWEGEPIKSVRTGFRRIAKRAGLSGVTPYALRHTGATLLAGAGVPMRQIAGMMGHSDSRVTETYYAKHRPEYLQEAATALDSLYAMVQ